MELRIFIKEALKDIISAVKDAQDEIEHGAIVPDVGRSHASVELGINNVQAIEFEVTVNVDESKGSEAKLSVVAAVIGGKVQGQSASSTAYAGKLKFKIPVHLPIHGESS